MPIEALKALFDIATVALLGLTFLAGAGVLITGNIINKRQEVTLRRFDADLTEAKLALAKQQQRAANAETILLEIAKRQDDRRDDSGLLPAALKGERIGTLAILYEPNDTEAFLFAGDLFSGFSAAGW